VIEQIDLLLNSVFYISIVFGAAFGLLWVVFELSEKKPKKTHPIGHRRAKESIFAGGLDSKPSELNIPPTNYYGYLRKVLRTERLSRLHSGKLSTYISWMLIGMALIIGMMVALW